MAAEVGLQPTCPPLRRPERLLDPRAGVHGLRAAQSRVAARRAGARRLAVGRPARRARRPRPLDARPAAGGRLGRGDRRRGGRGADAARRAGARRCAGPGPLPARGRASRRGALRSAAHLAAGAAASRVPGPRRLLRRPAAAAAARRPRRCTTTWRATGARCGRRSSSTSCAQDPEADLSIADPTITLLELFAHVGDLLHYQPRPGRHRGLPRDGPPADLGQAPRPPGRLRRRPTARRPGRPCSWPSRRAPPTSRSQPDDVAADAAGSPLAFTLESDADREGRARRDRDLRLGRGGLLPARRGDRVRARAAPPGRPARRRLARARRPPGLRGRRPRRPRPPRLVGRARAGLADGRRRRRALPRAAAEPRRPGGGADRASSRFADPLLGAALELSLRALAARGRPRPRLPGGRRRGIGRATR